MQALLAKHFGEDVKMERNDTFMHTGIRHWISPKRDHATLDHIEYAVALKPVTSAELQALDDDSDLPPSLQACYKSLLGGAAWTMSTRTDVAVYIASLQRHAQRPKAVHLRRLNRAIRYMQTHPMKLEYRRLKLPVGLVAVGDSAYQAPRTEDGGDPLVMRGYMIALAHRSTASGEASRSAPSGKMQFELQMLDYASGRPHHVCRGVWSAELHNICDMLDASLIQLAFLEEVQHGPQTAARLRQLSEQGGFGTSLSAYTDSKSIWS